MNTHHLDAAVTKAGVRTNKVGRWQRYKCVRPDGSVHWFQTLLSPDGSVVVSNTPPPACTEHPGSKVVRKGTHQRKGTVGPANKRQRYLCTPSDGSPSHRFLPPLPRTVVDVGHDTCAGCEELLSPYRGTQAVARKSRHSLKGVVSCLAELAAGASYAQASTDLRARSANAIEHQQVHHHWLDSVDPTTTLALSDMAGPSRSWSAQRGKNGWRLAADLTEQYSPVLFTHLMQRVQAREGAQRTINDAQRTADPNAVLANPLCYVLDELPVVVHRKASARSRYQTTRWHLLVVSEIRWHHVPADEQIPFDVPPMREPVLRLVRAYPGASHAAWRLVLNELGVTPDFIVSDFGSAITKAVKEHYPAGVVGHVPSFFHMARNIRTALLDKPGAFKRVDGRKVLVEELEKSMDALTRASLVFNGPVGWTNWWDELLDKLADLNIPAGTFRAQRRIYEQPVAAAFPLLTANPHLPASNAAVESKIRMKLEPLLENRKQRYRNITRVNALVDLVVCKEQGLFLDTDAVAALIRSFNDSADGWAPKAREICDTHPSQKAGTNPVTFPYSSLLDPYLTDALYQHRMTAS